MNRKLGHQEQKREACYNQYILICGFKGDSIAKLWCFMWCLMSFLWFYIGSYVSFPKPICYMKFKVKLKLYDLVP